MNTKQIQTNLETILTLEYLGIHIENTKEEIDKYGIPSKQIYYFSVPEKSTIGLEGTQLTADDLIFIAKKGLSDMVIESCKCEFEEDDEFIKEVENNITNYLQFYVKIRNGEKWNKELGGNAVKKIKNILNAVSEYKEV